MEDMSNCLVECTLPAGIFMLVHTLSYAEQLSEGLLMQPKL